VSAQPIFRWRCPYNHRRKWPQAADDDVLRRPPLSAIVYHNVEEDREGEHAGLTLDATQEATCGTGEQSEYERLSPWRPCRAGLADHGASHDGVDVGVDTY